MYREVYSEFEIKEQWIKVGTDESYSSMHCVGTSQEVLDARIVTKNCRGFRQREKVRGTGTGKLTQKLHVPYAIYKKIYAMERSTLVSGVSAYGQGSVHPEFSLTQKVLDEDDEVKYKAYPRCVLESGPQRPIENGAKEVAELDLEIALLPDKYGECMYEALDKDLDSTTKAAWLESFSPALVRGLSGSGSSSGSDSSSGSGSEGSGTSGSGS